ncbi:uncharacterized protein LOC116307703 [Actinia tenebrosa]|uniref:Uncharacterized protein LOC116307703 n=1 Tax=Actinia tenebrosa TaxID=6105 RepID=A0A6P8J2P0_ACTTE|nr:uncharacterized protein LOC116307703 [Actinia tenebrosa]
MSKVMGELTVEGMELSHDEDENDISTARDQELEESPDTSPSDGFTAIMNEHPTSINTINNESLGNGGVAGGVKNDGMKKTLVSRGRKGAKRTSTKKKMYIEKIDSPTLINLHEMSSYGASHSFYTTPDSSARKEDHRNLSFSTKHRWTVGAKTTTCRALEFGGRVPDHWEELSKRSVPSDPKTGTRLSSTQSKIAYPCRKRKASSSAAKRGKLVHGGGGHCTITRIEKNVNINIAENAGYLVVGNNTKINICNCVKENKNELADIEEVEADGSYPSISPKKSLKVTADENFEKFMYAFQDIINRLHPLRDKGRFKEFYIVAEGFAGSSEPHIQILILIEKSMALSYQKEFTKSKEIIDEAMKMISNNLGVEMKNFLTAYSHVHLTGLSRRQNRLTEANKFVSTAKQNEEFTPFSIARVFIAYEHASNLTKTLSLMNVDEDEPWQIMKEDASKSLRECITLSQRIHETNSSIYLQRPQFSLVKLALMNLNCRTKTSRTQPVEEESIQEAERCIKKMEEYEGDISEALSIQLYVAKSDLCFRTKDFLQAKSLAQQALHIAEENTFSLEIEPIQDRLKDINKLLT